MSEDQTQQDYANPKWINQFADAMARAIGSRVATGARVLEHEDKVPDPSEICTINEGRKYDRAMGWDFYQIGANGKPSPEFRYRFSHWHPEWFADSSIGNGTFRAKGYVEKFKFLPEPETQSPRLSPSSERPRKIYEAYFVNCREFFETHTPCLIEVDPEEIEAEEATT